MTQISDRNNHARKMSVNIDGSINTNLYSTLLPADASTATNQNLQIIDIRTLQSLIETIQELIARLAVLSAVKGVNESLRVTPLSSVSTAVTGPITSANSIAEKALGGIAYTQRVAIENNTAIQSNINNVESV